MNVLAIDQGTSSTKALVIAPGGAVLGAHAVPVSPVAGTDGAVEQDPQQLLDSIVTAGREALRTAGAPVTAVGLANQGETVLRWDPATGRPFGPALSWQDRRAAGVARALEPRAERLTELTGLPLDPYFAAPKLRLLREQGGPEGVVTTVDAWLNHALAGAFVTDAATASRTLLLDLDTGAWSPEACAAFGITEDDLPRIAACDEPVGETTAFGAPLALCGLAVDQQAALFAESCFAPGEAKCTYGTGAFLLATAGPTPLRSGSRLAACVAWRLGDALTYCLDGQVYTAGAAISWLERLGLLREASDLDRLAGEAPLAPADEAVFVPALAGLGAPAWAPDARGAWTGLSLASGPGDLVRAVVWGVAAQVALLGAAMADDLGRPLERLRVDGGLARSRVLLQAQADLLQAPVEVYPEPDATALGVGALARLGAGDASGPGEAVGAWAPSAVVEPQMGAAEAAERLERHRAAMAAAVALAEDRG